jgi:two-component system chemotaxis sensor kinase CheA
MGASPSEQQEESTDAPASEAAETNAETREGDPDTVETDASDTETREGEPDTAETDASDTDTCEGEPDTAETDASDTETREGEPDTAAVPSSEMSRYLDDDELRTSFQSASEDHLQKLESGLAHLEQHPDNTTTLEELLREIHSLKGDSGMLGVRDLVTVTHEWEQQLLPVKHGRSELSEELADRLYQGLEAIAKLVSEVVTGADSGVRVPEIIAKLQGNGAAKGVSSPTPAPTRASDDGDNAPTTNGDASVSSTAPATSDRSADVAQTSNGGYRIETIRVETRNLDSLMTQAGELTVTKIRIAHRLAEIEQLVSLWEEWSRDAFINRFALEEFQRHYQNGNGNGNGSSGRTLDASGALEPLQNFYHRTEDRLDGLGTRINQLRNSLYEDTARLDAISDELEDGIRTLRLLPLSTIFNLYPRMVRSLARDRDKQVNLIVEGGETRADKRILEEMKDPLMHIIRNSVDHGIETVGERQRRGKPPTATIRLRGYQTATNIAIEISDDGRGLDVEKIKQTALKRGVCREEELANMTPNQIQSLIFMPGFSTRNFVTEVSGRGVGLDVVRTNVERLKGSIQVESTPGAGCTIRLQLGTTLATAHVLLVEVNGDPYALPVEFVQTARLVDYSEIFAIEGRETIILDDRPVSVARLADLLELPPPSEGDDTATDRFPCIILKVGDDRLGLLVDALIDEQDVVLKRQSRLLQRVRNISGATILGTGEVCVVLNPQDLLESVRKYAGSVKTERLVESKPTQQVLLLVEDSIATRTQEKRILEAAGYEVVTAVDGLDGLNKLKTRQFDAVVSDIQMPNLDGLELTARIRSDSQYSDLPIVLVTSMATDEDKRKGAEAGANAYITKSAFNQDVLLDTLRRLV